MDEQRKPRSREKKVVNEGKGVEKRGEGLGTGPVNNTGSYEDRRQQQSASQASPFGNMNQRPASGQSGSGRPVQQNPFGQQRPAQRPDSSGFPFGQESVWKYSQAGRRFCKSFRVTSGSRSG